MRIVPALLAIVFFPLITNAHKITFQIDGLTEDEVIIGYHYGTTRLVYDTISLDINKKGILEGEKPLQKGLYFLYTSTFYLEFLVVEQEFSITTSASAKYDTMTIEGSEENNLFKEFQLTMSSLQNEITVLMDSLKSPSVDSVAVKDAVNSVSVQLVEERQKMIVNNQGTFFASFIKLLNKNPDYLNEQLDSTSIARFRENYLNRIEDPSEFMRTPILHEYVMHYFENVAIPTPENITTAIDEWLIKCSSDSTTYQYWLTVLLSKYQDPKIMGMDAVWIHLLEKYCLTGKAYWLSEKTIEELRREVIFIKPNLIGREAPSFYAIDTTGNSRDFKTVDADYYVLFFYDPGCGHCKKKAPILNSQYDDIKALGGEIIGICTTTIESDWKNFIKKNDLKWLHLWDPKGQSDFRVNYNTRTTPQLYILDKNFTIIGKQLDTSKVVDFIEQVSNLSN